MGTKPDNDVKWPTTNFRVPSEQVVKKSTLIAVYSDLSGDPIEYRYIDLSFPEFNDNFISTLWYDFDAATRGEVIRINVQLSGAVYSGMPKDFFTVDQLDKAVAYAIEGLIDDLKDTAKHIPEDQYLISADVTTELVEYIQSIIDSDLEELDLL